MRKILPFLLIIPVLLFSALFFFSRIKKDSTDVVDESKLLINKLDYSRRPLFLLTEHSTGKLLTLYLDQTDQLESATIDLEYLSGDLLKGARSSIPSFGSKPFSQAFLLGSCSAGGKCSFDKDLVSGSSNLRLSLKKEKTQHILKGGFVFVDSNEVTTTDGRFTYTPTTTAGYQLLVDTLGLPAGLDSDPYLYPLAITSTSSKISGDMVVKAKNITSVMIYDGEEYQSIDFESEDDQITFALIQQPWSRTVDIIRDDLRGKEETQTFYVLGPIVLLQ